MVKKVSRKYIRSKSLRKRGRSKSLRKTKTKTKKSMKGGSNNKEFERDLEIEGKTHNEILEHMNKIKPFYRSNNGGTKRDKWILAERMWNENREQKEIQKRKIDNIKIELRKMIASASYIDIISNIINDMEQNVKKLTLTSPKTEEELWKEAKEKFLEPYWNIAKAKANVEECTEAEYEAGQYDDNGKVEEGKVCPAHCKVVHDEGKDGCVNNYDYIWPSTKKANQAKKAKKANQLPYMDL